MGDTQYFLGVGGEQQGPFSESQVLEKIRSKEVPGDALIWFEGMGDWQPIESIPLFQNAFQGKETPAAAEDTPDPTPSAQSVFRPLAPEAPKAQYSGAIGNPTNNDESVSTFASGKADPVFAKEDSTFVGGFMFRYRMQVTIGVGLIILIAAGVGSKLLLDLMAGGEEQQESATEKAKRKRDLAAANKPTREQEVRKALSELMLNPNAAVEVLRAAVKEKPDDPMGKEALQALISHYGAHTPVEAARILMDAKQPFEALKYFRKDPSAVQETEAAIWACFEASTDPKQRKDLLLEDIRMLLGAMNQREKAVERLRIFEKTFPGEPHEYTYYTKTNEEKLRDLFERTAFRYLQTLLSYMDTELPHVNLAKRPVVELKREKSGRYRIVGTYTGPIKLNTDNIEKVHFEFWLERENWVLVDTTLTMEKQKWVRAEREKLKDQAAPPEEMLALLEANFRSQFPTASLHERVTASVKKNDLDEPNSTPISRGSKP